MLRLPNPNPENDPINNPFDIIYTKFQKKLDTNITTIQKDKNTLHLFLKYMGIIQMYLPFIKLNENIDKFMEVLLGKTEIRTNLLNCRKISLIDLTSHEQLKREIEKCKSYLIDLSENSFLLKMANTDLLNIRDEILGDLNQFLYLLTFK